MAIGFKVNTNVIAFRGVVQVLDSGRDTTNGKTLMTSKSARVKLAARREGGSR